MFQKQTPKKFLHSVESSLCRVCANVCDKCHSNNLFSERNCVLLAVAETLHGKRLPQGDFPHLVCRPCSRRLNNTKLLQDQIHKSQALFESNLGERFKRCIEISPSAPKTIKSLKISTSTEAKMTKSRRGLSFSAINSLENVDDVQPIATVTDELLQTTQSGNPQMIARALSKIPQIYQELKTVVFESVDEELKTMCCRSENSVLRKHDYDSLSKLTWKEIFVEIEKNCPTTMHFLVTLVDGNVDHTDEKKIPPICLMYAIPMFLRVPELSKLQRLNTVLLTEGGASKMTDLSFNAYSFEMMVNVAQNEILLSEREAQRAIWSQTVNWKGGPGKNIEADLMQENRNNDHKAAIKAMGANKTEKAVHRATKAAGGQRQIVEVFDKQTGVTSQSPSHTHRSSQRDEQIIQRDLRRLRPFKIVPRRMHPSFPDCFTHPFEKVDFVKLHAWLKDHMQKMAG